MGVCYTTRCSRRAGASTRNAWLAVLVLPVWAVPLAVGLSVRLSRPPESVQWPATFSPRVDGAKKCVFGYLGSELSTSPAVLTLGNSLPVKYFGLVAG